MLSTTQNLQTAILKSMEVIKQSSAIRMIRNNATFSDKITEKQLFMANNKLAKEAKKFGLEAKVTRMSYQDPDKKEDGFSYIRYVICNETFFITVAEMNDLENSLKSLLPNASMIAISVLNLDTQCASYNISSFNFSYYNETKFVGTADLQNGGTLNVYIFFDNN